MMHDIVINFANHVDKSQPNRPFIDYHVVSGSIFNQEYSETLDSAVIVLSQIPKSLRLNISPYDYCRVYDKSTFDATTGKYAFDYIFFVDSWDEREENIAKNVFGYTINLMSETKILEKIQCPNLTITHDIKDGFSTKKTIYDYIFRYMQLFIPKVKYLVTNSTWSYQPIIHTPARGTIYTRTGDKTASISVEDFEMSEVYGVYTAEVLTSELVGEDIDFNSVTVSSVVLEDGYLPISSTNATFDKNNHRFVVRCESSFVASGTVKINFQYKTLGTPTEFFNRFNVPCADMSFNAPTLRQILTTLMQQVGCIPIVKNRTLGYLDLQKEAIPFAVNGDRFLNGTVNYIRRSISSDSFANCLINMSDNVLDSENEVVCETLCFRDRNNVLLQQEQNLKLETSLPIYKINKCLLHGPGEVRTGYLSSSLNCFCALECVEPSSVYTPSTPGSRIPFIFYDEAVIENIAGNRRATLRIRKNWAYPLGDPRIDAEEMGIVEADKICFWARDAETGAYKIVESRPFETVVLDLNQVYESPNRNLYYVYDEGASDRIYGYTNDFSTPCIELVFNNLDASVVGFFITGRIKLITEDGEVYNKPFTFMKFADNDPRVEYHDAYAKNRVLDYGVTTRIAHIWFSAKNVIARYRLDGINLFQTFNITKLIVERGKRQLLETNFDKMVTNNSAPVPGQMNDPSTWTVDNLSKYVYGTVEYSIGSKEISGFSQTYSRGNATLLGWIDVRKTYLENILYALQEGGEDGKSIPETIDSVFEGLSKSAMVAQKYDTGDQYYDPTTMEYYNDLKIYVEGNINDYAFSYYNVNTNNYSAEAKFFSAFFVDLYYQPLNSFSMSYVKSQEEIPLLLSQYDGNASGLTDFDRLSIHEQEQVDRIGNVVISISQRTNNSNDIRSFDNGPLYYEDDTNRDGLIGENDSGIRYVIFKRSIKICNNYFEVTYTGSKDAVLKDYFTSIRTKYRAYQYIDYSQSVLRKERDLLFVRVATNYYDGDNKIVFGENSSITDFIYDLKNNVERNKKLVYEIETSIARVSVGISEQYPDGYRLEAQTVKNSISLVSNDFSFALIYEYADNVGAGPYIYTITENKKIGGVPQSYQIWDEAYNDNHSVKFSNYIGFYEFVEGIEGNVEKEQIKEQITRVQKSPIVDNSFNYETCFSVVEDKNISLLNNTRRFYKDNAERINHTVQFVFYSPQNNFLCNENFIAGIPYIGRFSNSFNAILCSDKFSISKVLYTKEENDSVLEASSPIIELVTDTQNGIPYIKINWSLAGNHSVVKLCHYDDFEKQFVDIAVFKHTNDTNIEKFYFMINDTKTDKVYAGSLTQPLSLLYEVDTYDSETETTLSRTCHLRED